MFLAILFSAFAMFCCLVAYAAITFRRFLAFVIGPPRASLRAVGVGVIAARFSA